jgi:hypothetical protein
MDSGDSPTVTSRVLREAPRTLFADPSVDAYRRRGMLLLALHLHQ